MVAYAALQKQDKKALHPYSLRLKHFSQHVRRLWNKPPCFRQYSEETAWTAPQDKVAAAATVWWRPSLIDWKNKIFCDFEKDYPSFEVFSEVIADDIDYSNAESKRKQNGCLPLNSGKHPWWKLNYSILNRCPENRVHIICKAPLLFIEKTTSYACGRIEP